MLAVMTVLVLMALFTGAAYFGGKLAIAVFLEAEERRAIAECMKWEAESRVRPEYVLVEWQQAQCQHYGIEIYAPVLHYKN